jgi:hypothetical protein
LERLIGAAGRDEAIGRRPNEKVFRATRRGMDHG